MRRRAVASVVCSAAAVTAAVALWPARSHGDAAAPPARSADAGKPIVLFDGTTLDGWHHAGPGGFNLRDGAMVADNAGGMGVLWNDRPLADFVARVEYRVEDPSDDSGLFVRFPDPGTDPFVAVNAGHLIHIGDADAHNHTGAVYNFKDAATAATLPPGQWNVMEVRAVGPKYTVTLNGTVVNEFTSDRGRHGYLGVQNHTGHVAFRRVEVTDLPGGDVMADVTGQPTPAGDTAPGLLGLYYNDLRGFKALEGVKRDPFFVRVDPQVSFPIVEGDFYGTHLTTEFAVSWTGFVHVDQPGKYRFGLKADDGAKLLVNGKVAVDDAKFDKGQEKGGDVTLPAAGDYPIKVEFCQFGGGAECLLDWQPPGATKLEPVPAANLSHPKGAEAAIKWDKADWELFSTDHYAWIKKHGRPYEKMDYGPFLGGTFAAPEPKGNTTLKGYVVELAPKHAANVLFDTELCRYSAGWTDGFIDFNGVAYNGAHGQVPKITGKQVFGSPEMPGWEHDGSFADPRKVPYGPLPADWCHYRGLYRHGDDVVFSYTVNGVGVLDKPSCFGTGADVTFVRTLEVGPSDKPLTFVVCNAAEMDAGGFGVKLETDAAGQNVATIPPHRVPAQFSVAFGRAHTSDRTELAALPKIDFAALTHGGPTRWGAPIETKGKLGTGDGPYTVDTLTAPESMPSDAWLRFSGFDFFADGKSAAICTWNGDVWVVKGIDGDLSHLTWQRYATGLFQSLGLKIVNGEVYVLGRDQITRLHDLNGDGEADWYENFNNDCQVTTGFHEFQHDLQVDSKGNFYYAKGGPVNSGGRGFEKLSEDNGCVMQVSPDGNTSKVYATGLRAPNGMSMGPHDEITVSDNQGTWTPACRISFVTPGAFLGVPSTSHMKPEPKNYGDPICWFPYVEGDYTQGDNSSGGAAWDTTTKWGPFDGDLIHLSYGTCSIFKTMYETVGGVVQGGVCRFPLDFDSGIMRARFSPVDGQLYVCGLKGWQTRATKDGIFQRVRYTGKPVYMPKELHVTKDGIQITFTAPVDESIAKDVDNYTIEQWNYIWADEYGSPDVRRDNPKKKGHDQVELAGVTVSADRKTITLKIADLKPVMQMKIVMKIKSADGTAMNWEVDNTINDVPGQKPIATPQPGGLVTAGH